MSVCRVLSVSISLILLLIGGMLYIAFRTKTLLMFTWAELLGLDSCVDTLRHYAVKFNPPYFLKYCLPNALWLSSYIIMANTLIRQGSSKFFWIISLPLIAIIFEILQKWNVIPGVFDIWDLLCLVVPTIIYIFYFISYEKKN